MAGGQAEAATDLSAAEVGDRAAAVFYRAKDVAGVLLQGAPGFGEFDVMADAVEEAGVEFLFQRRDALAHRGLGEMECLCRPRKRTLVGDGEEGLEFFNIHASILAIPISYAIYKKHELVLWSAG